MEFGKYTSSDNPRYSAEADTQKQFKELHRQASDPRISLSMSGKRLGLLSSIRLALKVSSHLPLKQEVRTGHQVEKLGGSMKVWTCLCFKPRVKRDQKDVDEQSLDSEQSDNSSTISEWEQMAEEDALMEETGLSREKVREIKQGKQRLLESIQPSRSLKEPFYDSEDEESEEENEVQRSYVPQWAARRVKKNNSASVMRLKNLKDYSSGTLSLPDSTASMLERRRKAMLEAEKTDREKRVLENRAERLRKFHTFSTPSTQSTARKSTALSSCSHLSEFDANPDLCDVTDISGNELGMLTRHRERRQELQRMMFELTQN